MQAPVVRYIKEFQKITKRNFGLTAPVLQSDPIQQLFVDKLREYRKKSADGTKMVDVEPEIEKELKSDLDRLAKQYKVDGKDMTQFPKFSFPEPKYDSISVKEGQ